MVVCFDAQMYEEKMNLSDVECLMYRSSVDWSWWFMCVQMNLSLRKVCGAPVAPDAREKSDKLHHITLHHLTVLIADGLDLKFILGSDQFGMHMLSQTSWQWEEKGPSEVKGCLNEDKSQSHPVVSEDPKFSHFLFSHTPNHWTSLETSLELAQRI